MGKKIGPNTYDVINRILKSYKAEQQGYTGCRSLLKLSDKYTNDELETACKTSLKYTNTPRYKNIKLILESGQSTTNKEEKNNSEGAILRGATYYGGLKNE